MYGLMGEFLLTLSLLSRVPSSGRGDLKRIPAYFGLVGYVVGLFYFLMKLLFPSMLGQLLVVAVGFWLFDMFHFDGLLDTLDGFLSQRKPSEKLQIMSLGNVGPSALLFGVLFVMAYVYAFSHVQPYAVFYSAVFGRVSMCFLLSFSVPAKESGLGRMLYPYSKVNTVYALLSTFVLLLDFKLYLSSLVLSLAVGYLGAKLSNWQIGGYTGDVLGALNMVVQLAILVSAFVVGGGS